MYVRSRTKRSDSRQGADFLHRGQKESGAVVTTHWKPRENSAATTRKVSSPNIVTAMAQNAAARRRKACMPRMIMTTRSAASTAIAMRPTASFQPGRFPQDKLKAETIWFQDQIHSASIVRNT